MNFSLVIPCHAVETGKEIVQTTGLKCVCRRHTACTTHTHIHAARDLAVTFNIDQFRKSQLQMYLPMEKLGLGGLPW